MHESYVSDGVAKSKMVVCTYLCKHIKINIYRNINYILHFGVLFVICLFLSVAHFVSYSQLFRILVSLFHCFNSVVKPNNISSFPLSC